jgi:hypothetical protein
MNDYNIEVLNLNNYITPVVDIHIGKKFITNGVNNDFFKYIKDRYNGSPTNAGIINSYVNYIIGEGLIEISNFNINKYISKRDIRLICQDYKLYGQFTLQIIWSQGSKVLKEEPYPIQFKHINTEKIGLNLDESGDINGYWYSFNWSQQTRYKPRLYPKFDGVYKDNAIELLTFNRISSEPYFPQPDYLSGLQYAHLEEELSNSAINHVLNGFSAGKVINCKGGVPPTDELRETYKNKIIEKLTGTTNKNKTIVSFSNGIDGGNEIEVTNIQIDQLDAQLVYFSEEAERKIFKAHSVVNPILFGSNDKSGFGNNKDEMKEALKTLYRSNINPMREVIIDSLEYLMGFSEPNISLKFKDFEELRIEEEVKNNIL